MTAKGMLGAISFLTVLGPSRPPTRRTFAWFPLVGAAIGGVVAGAHALSHDVWSAAVAGAVVLAIDLGVTGALHLDGLADAADGLLPHLPRERRLEVMAGPELGTFAVAVVTCTLLFRWSVLADPGLSPVTVTVLWATSRTLAASAPRFLRYARPGGLATEFVEGSTATLLLWLIPIFAWQAWSDPFAVVAPLAAVMGGAGVAALGRRRVGGFTGDVLGAMIVIAETAGLLAWAAT